MVRKLDSVQPPYALPPLHDIPDGPEDQPVPGKALTLTDGPFRLPAIVYGAGTLSDQYNTDSRLNSDVPFRTVRLALRYGITAFDTSAYYGVSEIVLGTVLKALEPEFPRSSYRLMTKCGRYGLYPSDFDYSPATVRASVMRSLKRLNTTYLDAVYMHDVEFVTGNVAPLPTGNPMPALGDHKEAYGLAENQSGHIVGDGDRTFLEAIAELRKLKAEGFIKKIGITGYPLPTLLRLAILVKSTTNEPLDILLSYSHFSLHNTSFIPFAKAFRSRAGIPELLTASPLSMGLLTSSPPPWHFAPPELLDAVRVCLEANKDHPGGLPDVALGFAYRLAREEGLPTVAGLSTVEEVHASIRGWREIVDGNNSEERKRRESGVRKVIEQAGYLDWSWASP